MTQPETLTRSGAVTPATFDRERRTVEVVWTTGAGVPRRDFEGEFVEYLSTDPAHVRLERLVNGPVLDAHRQDELRRMLGTVDRASITAGEGRATLRFSGRPDVAPLVEDVAAGIIRGVSVGYRVDKWQTGTNAAGKRTKTAIDWTPIELSLVPVAADGGASIRQETTTMETENAPATTAERAQMNAEIRALGRAAGLDAAFADGLIDRGATVEQARAAAFDELVRRGGGEIRTERTRVEGGASGDDPHARAERMGEALYCRVAPGHPPSEPARQFIGLSLPEMARDCLRAAGVNVTGLAPIGIVTRAMHSTSDFPLILGNTVGRTLRQAYEAAPAGVRQLSRETSVRDFRAKQRLMLSAAPTPLPVGEAGEYKAGTLAEARETYAGKRFGRLIGITVETMTNDDVGAFTDLSRRFGQAAAEFERQQLVDLLVSGSGNGPTMEDTKALFHADHGNKAASGAAPSETTLNAARVAMRRQKGLAGEPIMVVPKFILVPPELETTAEKLVSTVQATKTDDANVFTQLMLVVEPRLTNATRWYMAADPATIDGLEHCYVEGLKGPTVTSERDFDTDGLKVKVALTFGAGFVDWRSWYQNAGA